MQHTMPQLETETARPSDFATERPTSTSRAEACRWVCGFDFARKGEDLSALSALVAP